MSNLQTNHIIPFNFILQQLLSIFTENEILVSGSQLFYSFARIFVWLFMIYSAKQNWSLDWWNKIYFFFCRNLGRSLLIIAKVMHITNKLSIPTVDWLNRSSCKILIRYIIFEIHFFLRQVRFKDASVKVTVCRLYIRRTSWYKTKQKLWPIN